METKQSVEHTASSPYQCFSRKQWLARRHEWPMLLSEQDLSSLHGQMEQVSLAEVQDIYLPITRLISLYQQSAVKLASELSYFLDYSKPKIPFVIGVSGSVGVGKSTASRVLKALLEQGPESLKVTIVPTDGFLKTTTELEAQNLMEKKGFPVSYHLLQLLNFLQQVKSGDLTAKVPVYSHETYDIVPGQYRSVCDSDVIILEGLNILQTGVALPIAKPKSFVSDFLDFSVYVDADAGVIEQWFIERFLQFKALAMHNETLFFHRFSDMTNEQAVHFATSVWRDTNLANLEQNILPFKYRANLILHKESDHTVSQVMLRNI